MHYRRWRINGTLDDPTPRERRSKCAVAGCDAGGRMTRGLCARHYWRLKHHGETGPADLLIVIHEPDAVCSVEGCERGGPLRRTWCTVHYQRWEKHGDPTFIQVFPKTCTIDGCEKPHESNGLCGMHHMRLRRTGTTDDRPAPAPQLCSIEDCYKPVESRGWCSTHYARWWKHGDPLAVTQYRTLNPPKTCHIVGCEAPHFSRYKCRDHYRQWHHELNRDERNARMRQHYRDNRIYYAVKTIQRQRASEKLSKEDRDIAVEYRKAIESDPCTYCGGLGENTDHIFPVAKGGSDHWWNLVRACERCNKRKAAHCGTWFRMKTGAWLVPVGSVPALAEAG